MPKRYFEKSFGANRQITFGDARELFYSFMTIPKFLTSYSLLVRNFESGATHSEDVYRQFSESWTERTGIPKERDPAKRLLATANEMSTIMKDLASDDIFVANSADQLTYDIMVDFDEIKDEEADDISIANIPEDLPLIGEKFELQYPFVPRRDIRIEKENGIYMIKVESTNMRDVDKLVRRVSEFLFPDYS